MALRDGGSLSTALVARPAPGTQVPAGALSGPPAARRHGPLRRIGDLRRTSPGRLQLILAGLLILGVLTGLVAGLTGQSTAAGTDDLGNRAQPLLVEAETIYSALADADTTAAQAFLAGGLEPAPLTKRYNDDLDNATAALTDAARLTPEGSAAATSVRSLSSGVAQYAALVATARANNRQGLPIGSSYLSAASDLNRTALLPQAQSLFRLAQQEVDDGYRNAAGVWWVVLLGLLVLALIGGLLLAQRYLSRSTHRTFNVPLVGATALTVLLALGTMLVLTTQNAHLGRADDTGSTPVSQLAEARIMALRERGDEALTLAAHGSGSAYETDFRDTDHKLAAALQNDYLADDTRTAYNAYAGAHQRVRQFDDQGDYDQAVKLAIGDETGASFTKLTNGLGDAIDQRKAAFTAEIGDAGRGLGLLTILGPLLALAVCVLAFFGVRARLEEYR